MKKTRLIVARHGNTFLPGQTPLRVGCRTDLPLVKTGFDQAKRLAEHLEKSDLMPDAVFSGGLKRTLQTAHTVISGLNLRLPIRPLSIFNEIDYGPDEGKQEHEVEARIGAEALDRWNRYAIAPPGWLVDPKILIQNWSVFTQKLIFTHPGKTVLVITSNGVARFLPYLTDNHGAFFATHDIKLKTGAYALLEGDLSGWNIHQWNVHPN